MTLHRSSLGQWSSADRCTLSFACAELETHLHISDKTVAEFIIDTAREKKDVDEFKKVGAIVAALVQFVTTPACI